MFRLACRHLSVSSVQLDNSLHLWFLPFALGITTTTRTNPPPTTAPCTSLKNADAEHGSFGINVVSLPHSAVKALPEVESFDSTRGPPNGASDVRIVLHHNPLLDPGSDQLRTQLFSSVKCSEYSCRSDDMLKKLITNMGPGVSWFHVY